MEIVTPPGGRRPAGTGRPYRLAALLTVALGSALTPVVLTDARLAGRLVEEHGLLEWLQVLLFAGAGLIAARLALLERAERRSGAPDVLLAAGFGLLAVSEMELPRLLLGKSLKIGRLIRDLAAGAPREVLFVLFMAALVVGLAIHALRHRAELVAWGASALGAGWGRLLLLGFLILGATEALERVLDRIAGEDLPGPLLEETLELLAALYCFLAMTQRPGSLGAVGRRARPPRAAPRRPDAPGTR